MTFSVQVPRSRCGLGIGIFFSTWPSSRRIICISDAGDASSDEEGGNNLGDNPTATGNDQPTAEGGLILAICARLLKCCLRRM
jgi:hypothetical protein